MLPLFVSSSAKTLAGHVFLDPRFRAREMETSMLPTDGANAANPLAPSQFPRRRTLFNSAHDWLKNAAQLISWVLPSKGLS